MIKQFNQIRLLKVSAQTGLIKARAKAPEDPAAYAIEHDSAPVEIRVYPIDKIDQAKSDLANYQNTCEVVKGFAGSFYQIEAYVLEYAEVDSDGDYISDRIDYDYIKYNVWLNFEGGGHDSGRFPTIEAALDFARGRGGRYNVQINRDGIYSGLALGCDSDNFTVYDIYDHAWHNIEIDDIRQRL